MRTLLILSIVAVLSACSSAPKDMYERRAYDEQQRREAAVERAIDKAPKWMTELPQSNSAVFASGTAASGDFSMADAKAKLIAYGKICMAAGGKVSQQSKIFMQDAGDASYETSEMAIRGMCPNVDITGVETREIKRVSENGRYRSYVLVALPTGDANRLQKRKDQIRLQDRATARGQEVFKELDSATKN